MYVQTIHTTSRLVSSFVESVKHQPWQLSQDRRLRLKAAVNPFRTAVPFGDKTTWNLTGLSPERDCRSKTIEDAAAVVIKILNIPSPNQNTGCSHHLDKRVFVIDPLPGIYLEYIDYNNVPPSREVDIKQIPGTRYVTLTSRKQGWLGTITYTWVSGATENSVAEKRTYYC